MNSYFVTGTDTDVGKTLVTSALLAKVKQQQLQGIGLKPIASGCEKIDGRWQNSDALSLMQQSTKKLAYEVVNPIALPEAIAPHIAAEKNQQILSVKKITTHCESVFENYCSEIDYTFVEGAGGWFVPLNQAETFADIAVQLKLNIILVVGIRLGCINHALLTVSAIKQSGLKLSGWIANTISDDEEQHIGVNAQVFNTLKEKIEAPCLGVIPKFSDDLTELKKIEQAKEYLSLPL